MHQLRSLIGLLIFFGGFALACPSCALAQVYQPNMPGLGQPLQLDTQPPGPNVQPDIETSAHYVPAHTPESPDLEQRVQQLETLIKRVPEQLHPTPIEPMNVPGGVASDGGKVPVAGWDAEGFFLQSPDKQFLLRLTGQIQADYRGFANDHDSTDIDTFLLRRARFGLEATMFHYYEFRFLPDFGQGTTSIQDSYLNVHYWEEFQFEIGKFKQPVSYEQLVQDRYVPTMERSMIDQLTPARDVGVMVHGEQVFCDRLDYALALSNGEINGNFDNNQHSDLNGRIAIRPLNDPRLAPIWHGWQFGISGGFGVEQEAVNPATLKTPATVPWFQFNSTVRADGARTRWTPEISYIYRSLGFATQYYRQDQELRPAASGPTYPFRTDVPMQGGYVMATYLLTGEERTTYSEAIDPIFPFDPHDPFHHPGAWELILRTSRLEINDEVFAAGKAQLADPTKWSSGATELTVGFNWYFNKWARMQFNWEHAWFDDPVQLGTGTSGRIKYQDSLLTRFQIIF